MSIPKMFRACLMGVALAAIPTAPAFAQALRLAGGETQSALRVPLNRAIVLESEVPFAELSVANPLIGLLQGHRSPAGTVGSPSRSTRL